MITERMKRLAGVNLNEGAHKPTKFLKNFLLSIANLPDKVKEKEIKSLFDRHKINKIEFNWLMDRALGKMAYEAQAIDTDIEYVIWGIPPREKHEQVLHTKSSSYSEAKKIMKILQDEYGVTKARIQVLDLTKKPDFVSAMGLKKVKEQHNYSSEFVALYEDVDFINESTDEEKIKRIIHIGFDKLRDYKPKFVREIKKVMDQLVSMGVVEYGTIWAGQYNIKDRNKNLDDIVKFAIREYKKGNLKIDFAKIGLNEFAHHNYSSEFIALHEDVDFINEALSESRTDRSIAFAFKPMDPVVKDLISGRGAAIDEDEIYRIAMNVFTDVNGTSNLMGDNFAVTYGGNIVKADNLNKKLGTVTWDSRGINVKIGSKKKSFKWTRDIVDDVFDFMRDSLVKNESTEYYISEALSEDELEEIYTDVNLALAELRANIYITVNNNIINGGTGKKIGGVKYSGGKIKVTVGRKSKSFPIHKRTYEDIAYYIDDMSKLTESNVANLSEREIKVGDYVKIASTNKLGPQQKKILKTMQRRAGMNGAVMVVNIDDDYVDVAGNKMDALLGTLSVPKKYVMLEALSESMVYEAKRVTPKNGSDADIIMTSVKKAIKQYLPDFRSTVQFEDIGRDVHIVAIEYSDGKFGDEIVLYDFDKDGNQTSKYLSAPETRTSIWRDFKVKDAKAAAKFFEDYFKDYSALRSSNESTMYTNESYITEGRKHSFIKDVKTKQGENFKAGTEIDKIEYDKYGLKAILHVNGLSISVSSKNLYKYVSGFKKPPSMRALEKMASDGIARSITGKKVEPDGFGPDGSPSWLIALGLV